MQPNKAPLPAYEQGLSRDITQLAANVFQDIQSLAGLDAAVQSSVVQGLTAKVQDQLRGYRSLLSDLQYAAEEQETPEQTQRVVDVLSKHQADYDSIHKTFQNARIYFQRRKEESYVRQQRQELIGSVDFSQRQQKIASEQDAVLGSQDVTASLRRTRQLMAQNMAQTHGNISVIAAGNKRLQDAGDELSGQKHIFKQSHGLLGTLKLQSLLDRFAMWGGFTFFLLVVLYISFKRTPAFMKQPVYSLLHMKPGGKPFDQHDYAAVNIPAGTFKPSDKLWAAGGAAPDGPHPSDWAAWDANFADTPGHAQGVFKDAEWLDAQELLNEGVQRETDQMWQRAPDGTLLPHRLQSMHQQQQQGPSEDQQPEQPPPQQVEEPGAPVQQAPAAAGQCKADDDACQGASASQPSPGPPEQQAHQAAPVPVGEAHLTAQQHAPDDHDVDEDELAFHSGEAFHPSDTSASSHLDFHWPSQQLQPLWQTAWQQQQQAVAPQTTQQSTALGIIDPVAATGSPAIVGAGHLAEHELREEPDHDELEYMRRQQQQQQQQAEHERRQQQQHAAQLAAEHAAHAAHAAAAQAALQAAAMEESLQQQQPAPLETDQLVGAPATAAPMPTAEEPATPRQTAETAAVERPEDDLATAPVAAAAEAPATPGAPVEAPTTGEAVPTAGAPAAEATATGRAADESAGNTAATTVPGAVEAAPVAEQQIADIKAAEVDQPAVEPPVAVQPVAEATPAEAPAAQEPATTEAAAPVPAQPAEEAPAAQAPAVGQPVAEDVQAPAAEVWAEAPASEPPVGDPAAAQAMEEPAAVRPAVEVPVVGETPAIEAPTVEVPAGAEAPLQAPATAAAVAMAPPEPAAAAPAVATPLADQVPIAGSAELSAEPAPAQHLPGPVLPHTQPAPAAEPTAELTAAEPAQQELEPQVTNNQQEAQQQPDGPQLEETASPTEAEHIAEQSVELHLADGQDTRSVQQQQQQREVDSELTQHGVEYKSTASQQQAAVGDVQPQGGHESVPEENSQQQQHQSDNQQQRIVEETSQALEQPPAAEAGVEAVRVTPADTTTQALVDDDGAVAGASRTVRQVAGGSSAAAADLTAAVRTEQTGISVQPALQALSSRFLSRVRGKFSTQVPVQGGGRAARHQTTRAATVQRVGGSSFIAGAAASEIPLDLRPQEAGAAHAGVHLGYDAEDPSLEQRVRRYSPDMAHTAAAAAATTTGAGSDQLEAADLARPSKLAEEEQARAFTVMDLDAGIHHYENQQGAATL